MPEKKKGQPEPIVLADYQENQNHINSVFNAQQTLADKLWFGFEYTAKNDLMRNADTYQEQDAIKYGFNPGTDVNENDESLQKNLRFLYRGMAEAGSIEDYKNYFRTLGSMKARTVAITGKYVDSVEKALGENTPNLDKKATYLYRAGGLGARADSCNSFCYQCEDDAQRRLGRVLEEKYDYKTVTVRQFAQDMGINIDELGLPEGDADKTVYDIRRPQFKTADEETMKSEVFQYLHNTFGNYFVTKGDEAEVEKMTEEQKRLHRKGLRVGQRAEEENLDDIEEWIQNEGEEMGNNLLEATKVSNMKDARHRTQLSGPFGYDSQGFLDNEIKKEAARTRYIGDVVGKKKDIEKVKDSIVKKANRIFYADSLRRYPRETPAPASYDNYVILHTGSNAGNTPDEMVNNLSKALAASALKAIGRDFSLKDTRRIGEHFKELYALDSLKEQPELLKNALQDESSVLKVGQEMRKALYGVTPDKQHDFSAKMHTLLSHLLPPDDRSKEYKKFYEAVKNAAELEEKLQDKTPEEKNKAYCQANLNVFDAVCQYTDGKEAVRFRDTGKLSFDHALDAMAICSEANPNLSLRTDKIIGNINRVRNKNNPEAADYIDANRFHEHYGAAHSQRSVEDYSGRNRNRNIVNDPENEMNGPQPGM